MGIQIIAAGAINKIKGSFVPKVGTGFSPKQSVKVFIFNGITMNERTPHWSEDAFWTDALDRYQLLRENGQISITIDLKLLEENIFSGDSPAYKMVEAMCSVREHEGWDGYRGAPRLVLALLTLLNEKCELKRNY